MSMTVDEALSTLLRLLFKPIRCECGWSGTMGELEPTPWPWGPGHCPSCKTRDRLTETPAPDGAQEDER